MTSGKNASGGFWLDETVLARLEELTEAEEVELLALLEAEALEEAERSLAGFVQLAWSVIEPTTPLVWGRHLDAICLHLEAVTRGDIRNLIIEVPPRSSKSTVASVLWPVWTWLRQPSTRFLTASYALNLAIRDALRSRRVMTSPWLRKHWGERFRLTGDQNVKSRYENDHTGYRIAMSVNSGTTGEGGDITLIDDAHNVKEAESEAIREATIQWHDEAFYNRLNNAKTGRRVVIGQRVKTNDLIGHLLARGGWEELRIPEEYEPEHHCRTSIWEDWRTEEGELLRPERFGPEQVAEARRTLGEIAYQSQHQQRPVPREGALFKRDWFRYFSRTQTGFEIEGKFYHQDDCVWFGVTDPAGGTSKHADYTATGIFAVTPDNRLLLVHVDRVRYPVEQIVPHLATLCEGYPLSYLCIEASFLQRQLFVDVARRTAGLPPVRELSPAKGSPGGRARGDKYARAIPAVVAVESGQVYFREKAKWLEFFELEMLRFTGHDDEHDDMVDCVAWGVDQWQWAGTGQEAVPMTLGSKPDNFGMRLR